MIVSIWALGVGAGGLIAAGFYIMACHSYMRGILIERNMLLAILEKIKEDLSEDQRRETR